MSDKQDTIAALVAEIPALRKEGKGQVGNRRYDYLTLDTIMHTIRPALTARGWSIHHSITNQDGAPWMVTQLRAVNLAIIAETGCPILAPADMQKLGAAITYARRYSVCMLLGLVADEDDDAASVSGAIAPSADPEQPPKGVTEELAELGSVGHLSAARQRELKRYVRDHATAWSVSPKLVGELIVELFEDRKFEGLSAADVAALVKEIEGRGEAPSEGDGLFS